MIAQHAFLEGVSATGGGYLFYVFIFLYVSV
nr:MAG TPA: hypothetical protein [Caudoviricetes sp.]